MGGEGCDLFGSVLALELHARVRGPARQSHAPAREVAVLQPHRQGQLRPRRSIRVVHHSRLARFFRLHLRSVMYKLLISEIYNFTDPNLSGLSTSGYQFVVDVEQELGGR